MSAVLIGSFFALCLAGVPIAFAMGLSTLIGILYHGSLPLSLLAQRTLVGVDSYALLAVPFFILAGNLMNSGGITDQIIRLAVAIVGRFRGGLALTSVLRRDDLLGALRLRRRRRLGARQGADPGDEAAGLRRRLQRGA